jgi:hypothetical protein
MRWVYYELNVFGDPTIAFRGVSSIGFTYPSGVPDLVDPGTPTSFDVVVDGIGEGVPVPGTGQLHYSLNGSPVTTVDMTQSLPNHYLATLPALSCGDVLDFYVSAEEETHGRIYNPDPSNPNRVIPVTEVSQIFYDDFETDKGWTVSGGQWARGIPTGGGGEYGGPDPIGGYILPNVFGYQPGNRLLRHRKCDTEVLPLARCGAADLRPRVYTYQHERLIVDHYLGKRWNDHGCDMDAN